MAGTKYSMKNIWMKNIKEVIKKVDDLYLVNIFLFKWVKINLLITLPLIYIIMSK